MLALLLVNLIPVATCPHFCTSMLRGAKKLPFSVSAIEQFNKRDIFYIQIVLLFT